MYKNHFLYVKYNKITLVFVIEEKKKEQQKEKKGN